MTPLSLTYRIFSSPLGEILVAGSGSAVRLVTRGEDRDALAAWFRSTHKDATPIDNTGYIHEACALIGDYLNGNNAHIGITVELSGTDFQRKVWQALLAIPHGTTLSYSAIAERIGSPDAFRAVANACGDNPTPLIVPCHRAIHKNGDIKGFGWGEEAKRFLLALEQRVREAAAA